jgi:D-alanine--poly(phosphoribitol) ligase subunit 2
MEKLLALLNEIQPGVDYGNRTDLIDGHILESLSILSLVAAIEDTFDITVPAVEIVPKNFNSAAAMYDMIRRLSDEE